MSTDSTQKAEDIVDAFTVIFVIVLAIGFISAGIFWSFEEGQLDGYCQAVGGKVENTACVKDNVILKRGSDI
jgi:hypothetical protein